MPSPRYPSDLSDEERVLLEALLASSRGAIARQLPLQHERALVLPAVGMWRYQHARTKAPLHVR